MSGAGSSSATAALLWFILSCGMSKDFIYLYITTQASLWIHYSCKLETFWEDQVDPFKLLCNDSTAPLDLIIQWCPQYLSCRGMDCWCHIRCKHTNRGWEKWVKRWKITAVILISSRLHNFMSTASLLWNLLVGFNETHKNVITYYIKRANKNK